MSDFTMDQIIKMRRDLEKRIRIDINTFEHDSGCHVTGVEVTAYEPIGQGSPHVADIKLQLEIPR